MAQVTRPRPVGSLLATDGKRRPRVEILMAVTVAMGALAIATAFFESLHLVSSWAGLVGILTGGIGQYVSATTRERFVLIVALGASAVGFFIGMAHGGLFGGVIG